MLTLNKKATVVDLGTLLPGPVSLLRDGATVSILLVPMQTIVRYATVVRTKHSTHTLGALCKVS